MLVYGDAVRREGPAFKLARIRACLSGEGGSPVGIVRHAALVWALVEAGELAQGIADAAFAARGDRDGHSPGAGIAMELALALAHCVGESWSSGFEAAPALPWPALAALDATELPDEVECKLAEGFAHYCVYPESYWDAARPLRELNVRVLGIRSIGTTLAAMVAAATDAPVPITLRPVGHPFARELSLDDDLAREIGRGAEKGAGHAIVDEGPGLSGSSMACVAERLQAAGQPPAAIHLFPSHANGPGPQAPETVRAVWARLRSHVVTFDQLVLAAPDPRHRLEHWVRDIVGDVEVPPRDISGGAWRALRCRGEAHWPPVIAWQERRKFLLRTAGGTWLMRFAGLGRSGTAKFERARRLADAAFVPEIAGHRHGFIVERWRGDAAPIAAETIPRPVMLARIAAYLAFRVREFPSERGRGASLGDLFEMARTNAAEALGADAAALIERTRPAIERLDRFVSPIETDNRLHAWEWLDTPDGLLKADALDHHAGHDLVGDQDVAWDVAGAAVELALDAAETGTLAAEVERLSGSAVPQELVGLLVVYYRTFQIGIADMGFRSTSDDAERRRLRSALVRYGEEILAASA